MVQAIMTGTKTMPMLIPPQSMSICFNFFVSLSKTFSLGKEAARNLLWFNHFARSFPELKLKHTLVSLTKQSGLMAPFVKKVSVCFN
jgi:hypothetical protein